MCVCVCVCVCVSVRIGVCALNRVCVCVCIIRLVAQIHDELLFEVEEQQLQEFACEFAPVTSRRLLSTVSSLMSFHFHAHACQQ